MYKNARRAVDDREAQSAAAAMPRLDEPPKADETKVEVMRNVKRWDMAGLRAYLQPTEAAAASRAPSSRLLRRLGALQADCARLNEYIERALLHGGVCKRYTQSAATVRCDLGVCSTPTQTAVIAVSLPSPSASDGAGPMRGDHLNGLRATNKSASSQLPNLQLHTRFSCGRRRRLRVGASLERRVLSPLVVCRFD